MTHDVLVSEFAFNLLGELETERERSLSAGAVISLSHAEILHAINAAQYFERNITSRELWIIHRYLNWLEERIKRVK